MRSSDWSSDVCSSDLKLARWLVEEGVVQPSVTPAQAGVHEHGGSGSEKAVFMDSRLRGNDGERARLADMAEQAARLAKADLVTGMVGEFPELQGVMGGYYARAEGLTAEVAEDRKSTRLNSSH